MIELICMKDYHLQELLFNLAFAPQNYYCFAIDAKSSALFQNQMRNLSECFGNVFIGDQLFRVDRAGHNMTSSYLQCLQLLAAKPNWKYAILLQNSDVPLKTNHEMVQILRALNGSNDINITPPKAERVPNGTWTFKELNLFKDVVKNDDRVLRIAKGNTGMSLSRAFVKFIIEQMDLTKIIQRFEKIEYGLDEMIFPSIHSEDAIDAPGGFTRHCIGLYNSMITRYVNNFMIDNLCIFQMSSNEDEDMWHGVNRQEGVPAANFAITCAFLGSLICIHSNHRDHCSRTKCSRSSTIRRSGVGPMPYTIGDFPIIDCHPATSIITPIACRSGSTMTDNDGGATSRHSIVILNELFCVGNFITRCTDLI